MLHWLRSLWRATSRRGRFEDDMDAEMRFHLETRAADLRRRGLAPPLAARLARLEFGSIEKQKDLARAGIGLRRLDEIVGDFRYALRTFVRNRAFAAAAVVTLALGIGANAAIFNLFDALVLRSLPVPHPEQLLLLKLGSRTDQVGNPTFSYPLVRALDAERDIFAGVAGFSGSSFAMGSGESLRRVPGAVVTGAFYETLGLTPAAGRLLTRADDVPGAAAVAVASFGFWERQFGLSPAAIGQAILLDGVPVVIVGVSPRGFAGANVGAVADITLPAAALTQVSPDMAPLLGRGNSWMRALARLRPGVSQEQASARLAAEWPRIVAPVISPEWPAFRKEWFTGGVLRMAPGGTGWTYLRDMYVKPLRVLMAVVALVLLIACANVASLLLARASARRKEIAVRMAIGAGRARLVRQLLVESGTLALAGAAGGIVLATLGGHLLVGMISPGGPPLVFDLTPNWRVIGFTTAVATATALLFGLAPALQSTAAGPAPALREDARTGTPRLRLLPSLVTAQIALSLVLLIGATLFVRTLRNLQTLDPGFRAEGVVLVDLDRRGAAVPATVLDSVRAIPGVVSATVSTHTPLSGSTWTEAAMPAGQPLPERENAVFVGAGPAFFSTLAVGLVAGREFTDQDTADAPAVAIVNQRYADRFFPKQNPVGQFLTVAMGGTRRDLEIVGMARNTNATGLRRTPSATVYVPYSQVIGDRPTAYSVRASGSLAEIGAAMLKTLQPLVPNTPLEARPLSLQLNATIAQERMMAALAGAFGVLALVLASVGIYGLLAYSVARRTREIGIRMALGARRNRVVALVLGGALKPLAAGLLIGLPAAWAAARWIESLLFGLKPTDPVSIALAILALIVVAQAAAWLPARRAARVDPLIALRSE
jgi:putative ABC transport system permease protein